MELNLYICPGASGQRTPMALTWHHYGQASKGKNRRYYWDRVPGHTIWKLVMLYRVKEDHKARDAHAVGAYQWSKYCQPLEHKKTIWRRHCSTSGWNAVWRAMTEVPWRWRKWVTKFATGKFAHGKNMRQWQFWMASHCPCYHQELEDKQHILWCTAPTAQDHWNKVMQDLEAWLQSAKMDPKLAKAIMAGLRGWYSGANLSPMNLQAVIQQNWLGWDLFTEGRLSQEWQTEQAKFWAIIKRHRLSKQWVAELIKKLWEICGICGCIEMRSSIPLKWQEFKSWKTTSTLDSSGIPKWKQGSPMGGTVPTTNSTRKSVRVTGDHKSTVAGYTRGCQM